MLISSVQADLCRILALDTYGGIYLDFDVLCVQPFERLLHHQLFVAEEPQAHKWKWGFTRVVFPCNAIMGSQPSHPFWSRQLELIEIL